MRENLRLLLMDSIASLSFTVLVTSVSEWPLPGSSAPEVRFSFMFYCTCASCTSHCCESSYAKPSSRLPLCNNNPAVWDVQSRKSHSASTWGGSPLLGVARLPANIPPSPMICYISSLSLRGRADGSFASVYCPSMRI